MPLFADNVRSLAHGLVAGALIVMALVLGRTVLVPFALALLLTFVLAPAVQRLVKMHVPRSIGVTLVAGAVVVALLTFSSIFSAQLVSLAGDLGQYKANLVAKMRTISGSATGEGPLRRAAATIETLGTELKKELQGAPAPSEAAPTSVVIAQPDVVGLAELKTALEPIALVGLTLLFTVFLMLEHRDLRDRLVRLVGTDNMTRTTAALNDAGARLSGLLTMQVLLNTGFGAFVGAALFLIGVPNPVLWGITTAIMRFVPFIGSFLAAVPPILLAAAVDPGWSMVIATLALFVISEPLMGHVVEPVALGNKAGLSPLALVVAASFWTMVWGPIGLILAAPLTVVLVVLGQYVPRFEFMSVLLGDAAVLTPEEAFYHHLLTGEAEAAFAQFSDMRDEEGTAAAAETIVLPALRRAASDHRRGQISDEQIAIVQTSMGEIVDLLALEHAAEPDNPASGGRRTLVVPARGPIDILAARFIALLLSGEGGGQAEALMKGTGLMALASASGAGDDKPDEILLVTVGGLNRSFNDLLRRRAKRDFPTARVAAIELGTETEAGVSAKPKDDIEVSFRTLLERHAALRQESKAGQEAAAAG